MADTLRLTLKFPFKSASGETISSVPIRRLKRKDISEAQKHTQDEGMVEDLLAAKMTGMTLEDLGELDIADSKRVTEVFREMVGGGDLAGVLGRGAAAGAADTAQ